MISRDEREPSKPAVMLADTHVPDPLVRRARRRSTPFRRLAVGSGRCRSVRAHGDVRRGPGRGRHGRGAGECGRVAAGAPSLPLRGRLRRVVLLRAIEDGELASQVSASRTRLRRPAFGALPLLLSLRRWPGPASAVAGDARDRRARRPDGSCSFPRPHTGRAYRTRARAAAARPFSQHPSRASGSPGDRLTTPDPAARV